MSIQEIENLSFAELKQRSTELAESLSAALLDSRDIDQVAMLAARYVQARTDAKQRDETLAEQGTTISNLNNALVAAEEKSRRLEESLNSSNNCATKRAEELDQACEQIKELTAQLRDQDLRCKRLKYEATRKNEALYGAANLINNAIAAQQVDDADQGE